MKLTVRLAPESTVWHWNANARILSLKLHILAELMTWQVAYRISEFSVGAFHRPGFHYALFKRPRNPVSQALPCPFGAGEGSLLPRCGCAWF